MVHEMPGRTRNRSAPVTNIRHMFGYPDFQLSFGVPMYHKLQQVQVMHYTTSGGVAIDEMLDSFFFIITCAIKFRCFAVKFAHTASAVF